MENRYQISTSADVQAGRLVHWLSNRDLTANMNRQQARLVLSDIASTWNWLQIDSSRIHHDIMVRSSSPAVIVYETASNLTAEQARDPRPLVPVFRRAIDLRIAELAKEEVAS